MGSGLWAVELASSVGQRETPGPCTWGLGWVVVMVADLDSRSLGGACGRVTACCPAACQRHHPVFGVPGWVPLVWGAAQGG